jgi:hypothetical protein
MNASELIEELKSHVPNAPIVLIDGNSVIVITSVMKSKPDTAVRLLGQRTPLQLGAPSPLLTEALAQGIWKRFSAEITPSIQKPGKFQVSIDGAPAPVGQFDTEAEAQAYARGFVIGFSAGGGIKNMADGLPSRLT